jgi:Protein of unknown function (DUF4232)
MIVVAVLLAGILAGCGSAKDEHPAGAGPQLTACREGSLRVSDAGSAGVAAGTLAESLEFQSDRRCYLRGRPSVWLLSGAGRRLAVVSGQRGASARPIAIWERHPTYANLFYANPLVRPKACKLRASAMSIGVTGFKRRIKVKFKISPMRFCPGTIVVSGFGGPGPISL